MSSPIGRLVEIHRHPVKSMRGESLSEARLYWHGLEGDRRYGFVQEGDVTRFPWFTAREYPDLVRHVPHFTDPSDPVNSPVQVSCPDGETLAVDDPALRQKLERASGKEVRLLHLGRGAFDSMGVSLITTTTLDALRAAAGVDSVDRRFRINLVIEPYDTPPFIEEGWVGQAVRIGQEGAAVRLLRQIQRCMVVNLNPETGKQDPSVLRVVAQQRQQMAGIYGSTEQIGALRVGDEVRLVE